MRRGTRLGRTSGPSLPPDSGFQGANPKELPSAGEKLGMSHKQKTKGRACSPPISLFQACRRAPPSPFSDESNSSHEVPSLPHDVPDLRALDRRTLRACFKIQKGPVFAEKAAGRGATREHTRQRSVTEEQRSPAAFSAKTLRAAGLLPAASVGSTVTARCGDAPVSPPWPQPKSLAAGPFSILKQALRRLTPYGRRGERVGRLQRMAPRLAPRGTPPRVRSPTERHIV